MERTEALRFFAAPLLLLCAVTVLLITRDASSALMLCVSAFVVMKATESQETQKMTDEKTKAKSLSQKMSVDEERQSRLALLVRLERIEQLHRSITQTLHLQAEKIHQL
eukprot:TRINITY_DN17529_c0_g1_i1.p1 TRINITY_DN17529_c0_g1~~TRINITY_DN17529_c0_g1_i1.p1  ORF type:complete len:109 (-),score=23.03 TRINITY_DN17529_c0_g1_i1:20-346(-)